MSVTPTTRSRSPRGQGQQLRDDLLAAAADLFAEHGNTDAVSLRAVASRAGVSPTAVYRHFEDHDDLMHAAVEYCWAQFGDALAAGLDEVSDPYQRFRTAGHNYVTFAEQYPGRYQVMYADPAGNVDSPSGVLAFTFLVGMVTEILERNGDDRDPILVSMLVHAWMHGIVGLHPLCAMSEEIPDPGMDTLLDEVVERLGLGPGGLTA
jgi:AcrR family transcriptional regulator